MIVNWVRIIIKWVRIIIKWVINKVKFMEMNIFRDKICFSLIKAYKFYRWDNNIFVISLIYMF